MQGEIQLTNINVAYSIFPRLNDGVTTIFPWQPETPSTPPAVVMPPLYNLPIPNESMSAKRIRFLMLKKGQLLFSHDQLYRLPEVSNFKMKFLWPSQNI